VSEFVESENDEDGDKGLRDANRRLMFWFFVVIGANVAGLIWLAVRVNSPAEVRTALDVLFQIGIGASVAAFAFRTLASFPFVMTDLFGMVLVLAGWAKWTVDSVRGFSQLGFVPDRGGSNIGVTVQFFLLSASVLVAGAAFGLWTCQRLKVQRPMGRLVVILPAMLALPAAAGCAAFIALALGDFNRANEAAASNLLTDRDKYMKQALVSMVLWFASFVITLFNGASFIRTLALKAEIEDQAKI